MLEESKKFYKNLYSKSNPPTTHNIENINKINVNKLSDIEAEGLEGDIKYSEALEFLKNMKHDKSRGSDGFTVEFYKFFWIDRSYFIVRSINYSYNINKMSSTQN